MNANHRRQEPGIGGRKRRNLLRGLAALVVGCSLTSAFWPLLAADWPQLRGPQRDGVSPETGLLTAWPKDGPKLLWDKKIGPGYSGPVVADGRLILFHRLEKREIVQCLDAATGAPKWHFDYPTAYEDDFRFDDGPRATPLIAGKRVFTFGAEGKLHCLELADGTKVWDRDLATAYQAPKGYFGIASTPILEGKRLLVNIGGKKAGIVALDKDTGKELWKATNDAAGYSSPVAAAIDGVRHVIFFTREGIVSLDPENGTVRFQKRWRSRLDASVNAAMPLVVDDLLFVSACYGAGAVVHRVRKDGLDEIWKGDNILSNHYNSTVHYRGFLYGIEGRQEGGAAELRCVELKTGTVRWSKKRFGCASLILADGHLVGLCENGELVLIEAAPEGYREKARAAVMEKKCRAEAALANGRLYVRDGKRLACWELKK